MKEVQFTRAEIADLAKKVGAIADLSDKQRDLLKAIFAAAADRAMPTARKGVIILPAPEVRNQPADLMGELLNAYLPGNDFDDIIKTTATGKIAEGGPGGP